LSREDFSFLEDIILVVREVLAFQIYFIIEKNLTGDVLVNIQDLFGHQSFGCLLGHAIYNNVSLNHPIFPFVPCTTLDYLVNAHVNGLCG